MKFAIPLLLLAGCLEEPWDGYKTTHTLPSGKVVKIRRYIDFDHRGADNHRVEVIFGDSKLTIALPQELNVLSPEVVTDLAKKIELPWDWLNETTYPEGSADDDDCSDGFGRMIELSGNGGMRVERYHVIENNGDLWRFRATVFRHPVDVQATLPFKRETCRKFIEDLEPFASKLFHIYHIFITSLKKQLA